MLLSVTPSLYEAYFWFKNFEGSSEEEFLKTLRREPTPTTPAMQAGIDYEAAVYSASTKGEITGNDAVDELIPLLSHGEWQKRCQKALGDWVVYGRMDVYFPFKIYDIKKISKKYELGQYRHSIQHLIYMYCSDVPYFDYLICDKNNTVWRESYDYTSEAIELLQSRLSEMTDYIFSVPEFKKAYTGNWVKDI